MTSFDEAGEHPAKLTRHLMSLELMKLTPVKVTVGDVPSVVSTGIMEITLTLL